LANEEISGAPIVGPGRTAGRDTLKRIGTRKRIGRYQRAPIPVPERFMPDTAPDEPGIVGPVGVPPDPPALLLPKPVFG
jgi:hypothetical protein